MPGGLSTDFRLLKMIADKGKFGFFAYYCWIVGALTLVLTIVQW